MYDAPTLFALDALRFKECISTVVFLSPQNSSRYSRERVPNYK